MLDVRDFFDRRQRGLDLGQSGCRIAGNIR